MAKTTGAAVKAAIAKAGMTDIELVKGSGYFYFIGNNADDTQGGVYTPYLYDMSVAEWVEEAKSRYVPFLNN